MTRSFLDDVSTSMDELEFETSRQFVGDRTGVVGRQSAFRWRWFGVRLDTAVVVSSFEPGECSKAALEAFSNAASRYAIDHRMSGKTGPQRGTGVIPVVVTSDAPAPAVAWASKPGPRRFAVINHPVVVDVAARQIVQPGRVIVGGMFTPYLRGIVQSVFSSALGAS